MKCDFEEFAKMILFREVITSQRKNTGVETGD